MAVPQEILRLLERYDAQRATYQSGQYKETQIRIEFIDPFFKALGWDVANEHGYAEAYKDVIHEDALKIGGATEAPDACFRIGGVRKFFVECKKPSVNIKDDVHPAYQLRRYGWSAKLPLSILTDFHEWAVYDCRLKPNPRDTAAVGRIMYLTADQYPAKWDELTAIFSREAVLTGSFDKFVESAKGKRGTASVDDAFLEEIERWRDLLARTIALRNPALSQRELNFAVQRTIDRIIFLRICEDRGIEHYGRLMTLKNGERVYPRLCEFFQRADERYNSGIFCFTKNKTAVEPPDELTLTLKIDDQTIQDIVGNLYYPESPYEFSVLSSDILGQVYERFLGKVIRLTAGHQAKVEEKPEVRKAGGVYYTPIFIVDYIVKNTVGKLLEGKTPKQAAKLKILDPACGSGSFLIGAYQYLLNWHRDYYVNQIVDAASSRVTKRQDAASTLKLPIYQAAGGDYRLTTEERKRILINNIYGVDIDSQAVEVTKLSLLLKVLEGESQETIAKQFELFHQRALPDLGSNIKCGNSLIGPDFYQQQEMALFNEEERLRINVFDWQAEFSEIFRAGGFDALIGNPPWGAEFSEMEKSYLDSRYRLNVGKYESYIYFVEQATSLLGKAGLFGFILPSYWVSRSQTEAMRNHLMKQLTPCSFVVLPDNVFVGVKMDSCVVVAENTTSKETSRRIVSVAEISAKELRGDFSADNLIRHASEIHLGDWLSHSRFRFNPRITALDMPVMNKVDRHTMPFGDIVEITQGLTLYRKSTLEETFGKQRAQEILEKRLFHASTKKDATFKKELWGTDVARYFVKWNGESWVSYGPWLAHAVAERFFKGPRLVIQKLRNPSLRQRLVVGYLDDDECYSAGVLLNVIPARRDYSLFYCMGLLNSKFLNYWYRKCIIDVSIRVVDLRQVPIRVIDFSNPADKSRHDRMVKLVEQMLALHKQLAAAKTPQEQTALSRQIAATDAQIDQLVYKLYSLTDDEIRLVDKTGQ